MPLTTHQPIAFIPTIHPEAARTFYETTLGLGFVSDDGFALVFRVGPTPGTMLRVVRAGAFTPAPFTVFGWETPDIEAAIDDLTQQGVTFLRYPHFAQDDRAIWHAPGGAKVAWFLDPDGNNLSLSQHSA